MRSNIEHRVFGRWVLGAEFRAVVREPRTIDVPTEACINGPHFCRALDYSRWSLPTNDDRIRLESLHNRSAAFRALDVSHWSLPARDNRNCLGTLRHRTAAVSGSESVVRLNVADQKIQRGRKMKRHKSALMFRALDGCEWAGERWRSPGPCPR